MNELTNLEKDILEWFAVAYPEFPLVKQISCCAVTEREETKMGFFASLKVDDGCKRAEKPDGTINFHLNELKLVAPELADGADVILHIGNGLIICLEVLAISDGHPLHLSSYKLEKMKVTYLGDKGSKTNNS